MNVLGINHIAWFLIIGCDVLNFKDREVSENELLSPPTLQAAKDIIIKRKQITIRNFASLIG